MILGAFARCVNINQLESPIHLKRQEIILCWRSYLVRYNIADNYTGAFRKSSVLQYLESRLIIIERDLP